MRDWRGFLSSALFLLLMCGVASAQKVNVVGWQNGIPALAANVMTVTGMDLDDSTTVLVVGMYGDNSNAGGNGYSAVTFGGVPPTLLMNNAPNTRMAMAYWINPNTAAGQTLSFTYTTPFAGYYWVYELSNVDTSAPVATSPSPIPFGASTSLTTATNNSFVISYVAGNNNVNTAGTSPSPPLIQTGATRTDAPAGASMASATNTIATPGLQNIVWNLPPGNNLAQYSAGAFAFVPLNLGAPIVGGSVSPALAAPGAEFILTVTIDPFHFGNVTNVSVDLTSIGGSTANALVQSSDPNVWTNSFVVPNNALIGTWDLLVTVKQDAAPITGTGTVPIHLAGPSAPALVKDTVPASLLNMYVGQGVTFSASFSAPGFITYAWQKSTDNVTFTNIPGAANTTYSIPGVTTGDAGYYRLHATNFNGEAFSTATQITVNNATPAAYIWSAPIPFAGLSAEQILTNFPSTNKIAGAMVARDGGAPTTVILTNAASRPVTFAGAGNWASLSGGAAYVSNVSTNKTGNSRFDSVLNSGYNNNATHTITLGGLVAGRKYQVQLFGLDNRPGLTPEGSLQLSSFQDPADVNGITSQPFAMADNVYVLGTFTATSSEMTIQQNLTSEVGNFNGLVLRSVGWDPAPYFTTQPRSTNNFVGTTVSLTASAATDTTITDPTIIYEWAAGPVGGPYVPLTEGGRFTGVATPTLTVSNLEASDAVPVYVLRATNGGGTATSREAHIYVQSLPVPPPPNSYAAAVLALTNDPGSRLIGLWQLNETNDPSTGLLIAHDASGKGKSGTYGPTAQNGFNGVLAPQPPKFGGFSANQGALQTGTAGTGDATSVVSLPPLNITNGVATTICMWIYPTDLAPNLGGLLFNRGTDQSGFGFGGNTGGPSDQRNLGFLWNNLDGEATYQYNSGLFPVNNLWNFVVLVIRTNAATFYLNYVDEGGTAFFGKAADTAARYSQNNWTGSPIWIGGDPSAGGTTIFPGRISSVAVFNSALTDDQINELFEAGHQVSGFPAGFTQQPPESTTNFVGYTLQISAQPGGSSPITNQWKFNGVNLVDGWSNGSLITGANSNVLTIQNVSSFWQGVFNLAVTNALGGALSANANVTILSPVAPPSGNLVGRWFAGAQNLTDVSGHLPGVHDGTQILTNGVPTGTLTWSSDLPPKAAPGGSSLALTNSGVLINNSSTVDANYQSTFDDGISSAMSITFWAKGWPGVWNPFVSKYGETGDPAGGWQVRNNGGNNVSPAWTMRGNPGTVVLGTAVGGNAEDMAATSLTYGNDGKWHFYCATYDVTTGQRKLYVDGSLVAYTTDQGQYSPAPTPHLAIGARDQPPGTTPEANFTTAYYTGKIYDVRIYNTAITDAQQAYLAAPPELPAQTLSSTFTPPSGGNPGQLELNWLNGGKLLQATNVLGPWVTNQTATPPYTVTTTNIPGLFYKVLFP